MNINKRNSLEHYNLKWFTIRTGASCIGIPLHRMLVQCKRKVSRSES